jgi:hypothetical protein
MANTITIILSAVDRASAVFKRTEDSMQRMATTAQVAGAAMTAAFTVPLMMMANKSIDAASALREQINRSNLAFRENQAEIEKWAEGGAKAFGMSKRAALQNASSFGLMFRSMGFAEDQIKDMSKSLVELAADLSSAHDIEQDMAFEKLRAGLVGQSRPLQELGILLDETTVAQKALQMGLKATTGELTQQDKVMARLALIFEQAEPIIGDYKNTSGELAGSQRELAAELENANAVMGEKLLPTKLKLVKAATELAEKFAALPDPVTDAIFAVGGFVFALGPVLFTAGSAVKGIMALKYAFDALNIAGAIEWIKTFVWMIGQGGLGKAIEIAVPKLYALGKAAWASIGPFAALVLAIMLFVKVIHDNWATIQKAAAILSFKATGKMPDWAFSIDDSPRGALDVSSGQLQLENFMKQKPPEIPGFKKGGSFRVPPGYPDDSYLMGVSSGERVSVNPAGQGVGGNTSVTIVMPQISGATAQELADKLWPMLRPHLRRGGLAA